ncbi:branched-chain amino acid ABC transporter ATP-binding protein/permease [Kribbella solani]|uniref:branched-chain amino acid ABC transporter ATP-binding protein/permease n=1 Tax=Kribbella solani TaxID=236067 RepID=UPI00299FE371|nr:branched-chain amino acid ABC transporter ATP-binding protein/permease [Kribbella solani]MDX2972659.1 branched-chain amino acid ABC transporter ATP-binding protein/permease [Kribbella solani]
MTARVRVPLLAVLGVLLLAGPFLGMSGYLARTVMLVGILSLLTSGLNIVLGYAGELAVNQVFLYAVGAYVAAYLGSAHGVTDVLAVLAVVIVAAVVIGLVTGIPGLRLGGWSLAMVAFFMVLILPSVVQVLEKYTGGPLGLSTPVPTIFGQELGERGIYVLIVAAVVVWFVIARNLIKSAHGNAFLVLRQSPILAESLGISVFRLKLVVYVIAAVPCAIGGALFAWLDGFIAPDTFTFAMALSVLAASMFGGATSIYGALVGALLLQVGQQQLTAFSELELVIYGVFLLAAALVFRNGLTGLFRTLVAQARRRDWLPAAPSAATSAVRTAAPARSGGLEPIEGRTLSCRGIGKRFGGNQALDDVSIEAVPGRITALIGPNGSGKTTLLNLMCGFYTPTAGSIALGETVISGLKPFKVARAGVARTFQTPMVARGMTTRDFVAAGRYTERKVSMAASVLRLPSYRRGKRADEADALALLELVGIGQVAETEVSELPLGTRRLAEVARALAARPRLFLFDEVASGLDPADLENLERAIIAIRDAGGTVVLVEHNFPLVLKVSDTIHVLSRGELIASGTPDEIQRNTRVLEEYTGSATAVTDLELAATDSEGGH